ncbi:MAG: ABC transporter permease [Nocardioidaceae bacterium]
MSVTSFVPAPGSRPLVAMVLAHARMETRLLLRNGEQMLLALVIPLLLLVGGAEAGGVVDLGAGRRIDVLTPGVMALAVMSSSFTSVAIATAFERRYGVLKRLGASHLPRGGLLMGKAASVLVVELVQLVVISGAALMLGWRPHGGVVAVLCSGLLVVLGTWAFAALALLMAGSLRAEATLAAANLVYVVLLMAGAVVVPASSYPDAMRPIVAALPSGALAEGLRLTLSGTGLGFGHAVVLAIWAAGAALVTVRTFAWE